MKRPLKETTALGLVLSLTAVSMFTLGLSGCHRTVQPLPSVSQAADQSPAIVMTEPFLVVTPTQVEIEPPRGGQLSEAVFTITNSSDCVGQFELGASTMKPIEITPIDGVVAPGGRVETQLTFRFGRSDDGDFEPLRIVLRTNDPAAPSIDLKVVARGLDDSPTTSPDD